MIELKTLINPQHIMEVTFICDFCTDKQHYLVISYWSLCFLFCRCGVQFGHPKALTRALSLTPTVHHVSGSLAPSPIPMSSPSTLAARQTHPWTPSRSVSCGDRDWSWSWSEQGGEATAVITQNMPNVHLRLPNLDCQKSWWT